MIRLLLTSLLCVSSGAALAQSWPDPVANHVVPYQSLGITHGPVLGMITEGAVTVWIRTQAPATFEIVVG